MGSWDLALVGGTRFVMGFAEVAIRQGLRDVVVRVRLPRITVGFAGGRRGCVWSSGFYRGRADARRSREVVGFTEFAGGREKVSGVVEGWVEVVGVRARWLGAAGDRAEIVGLKIFVFFFLDFPYMQCHIIVFVDVV